MRVIEVKRGYSRRILFEFERQQLDKIPLYRVVSLKGGGTGRRQNPYLTELLKDRYNVYKKLLVYDRQKGRYTIDVDEYSAAVRRWYKAHGFVDASGVPYPWTAVHRYEDESRQRHPDDDWFNYPDELKKKGKSHHPISEEGRRREREKRAEYRAKKKTMGYNQR